MHKNYCAISFSSQEGSYWGKASVWKAVPKNWMLPVWILSPLWNIWSLPGACSISWARAMGRGKPMQTVLQQDWTFRGFLRKVQPAQIKAALWAPALTGRTGHYHSTCIQGWSCSLWLLGNTVDLVPGPPPWACKAFAVPFQSCSHVPGSLGHGQMLIATFAQLIDCNLYPPPNFIRIFSG